MSEIVFKNGNTITPLESDVKDSRGARAKDITYDWTKNYFLIGEVLDRDTDQRSENFGYRVGRQCYIHSYDMEVGKPLIVYYESDRYFVTTPIQDFFQDDGGLCFLTRNREYRFDNI